MEIREIKKNHPRFNSQFNRIRKLAYYEVRKGLLYLSPEGLYGPFLRTRFLENFIESMRYLYPIFITEDSFDFSYDIFGRRLTKKDLAQNSLSLNKILSDEKGMASFTNELRLLMKEAATEMRYERAMYYRDLINSLIYAHIRNPEEGQIIAILSDLQ